MKFLAFALVAFSLTGGHAALADETSATQLLVDAANHGRDDPAIRSGSGEVDEEADYPAGTPDEYTERIEQDLKNLRESLPLQSSAKQRAAIEQSIANAVKTTEDAMSRNRTYRSHWRVVFQGNRPSGELRRELRSPPNNPPAVTLGLREKSGGFLTIQETAVQLQAKIPAHVIITAEPFWDIPWFPDFGREIVDRGNFLSKTTPTIETNSARSLPSETVDGHELRVIEAVSSLGTKRRIWIDPARGFVCPRIESYDAQGRLVRNQEATGFFQEPASGVWFAERQVKTELDPDSGKERRRTRWHLDPASVHINETPKPEEFWLPIQAGTQVSDRRPGGTPWRADEPTVLKLVDGALQLDETPGLVRIGPRPPWEIVPKHLSGTIRWIVTIAAVFVTLALLALIWFLKLLITRTRLVE